mgnify:CR=1 FL=1
MDAAGFLAAGFFAAGFLAAGFFAGGLPPLPEPIARALGRGGVPRLWKHQTEGIAAVRRGENVLVTTPTASGKSLIFQIPLVYRWTDPVKGEQIREVDVVPPATVKLGSNVYVFPDAKGRAITVWMTSHGATAGTLRLNAPSGWKVEPASHEIAFSGKGDEQRATFNVTPPAAARTASSAAIVFRLRCSPRA